MVLDVNAYSSIGTDPIEYLSMSTLDMSFPYKRTVLRLPFLLPSFIHTYNVSRLSRHITASTSIYHHVLPLLSTQTCHPSP